MRVILKKNLDFQKDFPLPCKLNFVYNEEYSHCCDSQSSLSARQNSDSTRNTLLGMSIRTFQRSSTNEGSPVLNVGCNIQLAGVPD